MKNVDHLIDLLEEMNKEPDGRVIVLRTFGMSEVDAARYHHTELLVDAKLASQVSDSVFRITHAGYDFLEKVNQDRKGYHEKCEELFSKGKSVLEVINLLIPWFN